MINNLKKAQNILRKYNQEHLLYFLNELEEKEKGSLIQQILNTDFKKIENLYIKSFEDDTIETQRISPLKYVNKNNLTKAEKNKFISIGEDVIKKEKLAVITLAGGQGTRLGFKGPKGCYQLELDEKKSLFEVLNDKLKKVYLDYGVYIPWYIMTSEANDESTKKYLKEKNFFNYPKEKIHFFKQDSIEIIDTNGKILLDTIHSIKKASNGNGDVFRAFKRHTLEKTLDKIEWISVSGIDNIILEVIDPLFIGLTICNNSEVASKSIKKQDLESKDCVFAKVDDRVEIISPDNLDEEKKYSKNKDGLYNYNQMNILSHLFSKKAFLQATKLTLPYHRAFKKNDYIDESGMKVVVKEPNSFKFERFIFDVFRYFDNFTLLEVKEDDEFAPIKAFTGKYTPETALNLYCKKYNIYRKEE